MEVGGALGAQSFQPPFPTPVLGLDGIQAPLSSAAIGHWHGRGNACLSPPHS